MHNFMNGCMHVCICYVMSIGVSEYNLFYKFLYSSLSSVVQVLLVTYL